MTQEKLVLSFWKLSLENLPMGQFIHQRLSPVEAKLLIDKARQSHSLICVSSDDLLAPHKQSSLENHRELCRVLQTHFELPIAMQDFFSNNSVDREALFSINPLELVQIEDKTRLMIVTCSYSLPELKAPKTLEFQVIPDSVEFHLIAAC